MRLAIKILWIAFVIASGFIIFAWANGNLFGLNPKGWRAALPWILLALIAIGSEVLS